ncbi:MAG: hypothetical protein R2941_19135 [Desulfobacterales bacterium]
MASKIVAVRELQNNLSEIMAFIADGYDIIIEKDSKPFAKLIPFSDKTPKRIAGLNKGKIWMSDDFDEPLPDSFWMGEK